MGPCVYKQSLYALPLFPDGVDRYNFVLDSLSRSRLRPNRRDCIQDGALDRLMNLHRGVPSFEGSIKILYILEYFTRALTHVREGSLLSSHK